MIPTIFFLLGLLLLYLGGEALVRGSVSLALKLRISTLVIGMTIVSFATSAPELLVSLGAALKGYTDITFGNVIGSNIANIALVLGLAAILFRLNISLQTKKISFPFLLLSSIVFGIMLYFCNGISFWVGVVFVISLVIFATLLIRQSRQENLQTAIDKDELLAEENQTPIYKSISFIIVGIVLL
ncbi:MAG: sodium:calcium antiporter, partial [Bacteroidota bacterium]|nr:sodium:calcium antiporter [Bacteroidota bacterium]